MIDPYTNEILRKQFGEKVPPISDLIKTTSLIFVNQHYSLSGSKPLSPAVVELGGIHISDPKPIDPVSTYKIIKLKEITIIVLTNFRKLKSFWIMQPRVSFLSVGDQWYELTRCQTTNVKAWFKLSVR